MEPGEESRSRNEFERTAMQLLGKHAGLLEMIDRRLDALSRESGDQGKIVAAMNATVKLLLKEQTAGDLREHATWGRVVTYCFSGGAIVVSAGVAIWVASNAG